MKKVKIPYHCVVTATQKGYWDTLCYYVWLRAKFQKPVFYNYTIQKIADLLKISLSCAKHHVRRMIELKWAEKCHGHFKLFSINKLNIKLVRVALYEDRRAQKNALKYLVIKRKLEAQKSKVAEKSELLQKARSPHGKIDLSEVRFLNKMGGIEEYAKTFDHRIRLSNYNIAKTFKTSRRTASKLQGEMNKMGLLKSEPFFRVVNTSVQGMGIFFNSIRMVKRCSNTIHPQAIW